jgi:hypothetical protein
MCSTWWRTVLGEITSRWAISLLGSPRATSLRTSTSRGVRPERHLRRRTEGGAGIARFFWERCRYDWSRAELVTATVIDSNVLEQGSTWELRATPREGGGSDIEMVFAREFRSGARGAIGYTLNRVGGRRLFGLMLRKTLTAIQKSAEKGR